MFKYISVNVTDVLTHNRKSKKRFSFTSILTLVFMFAILYTNTIAYSAGNDSSALTGEFLNVRDYGARGDGLSDDSRAFQRAIDEASLRNLPLLIPSSDSPYLIRSTLRMRSNLHISGYGATLFMPSAPSPVNLLWSSSRDFVSNVTIEGLTLESVNDRQGTGYHANSLTSNVQGIYFMGVQNLLLKDVTINNMYTGLKFTAGINGELNRNITADNLKVINAGTGLLVLSTENFVMTNSILDAGAGASRFLHSAYIDGGTRDFFFDNVHFVNSPGGGLHIYNGYNDLAPARNMVFTNSVIDNVRTGVYIFSGAQNITISDLAITNFYRAFDIWDSSRIDISDVNISRQTQAFGSEPGYGFNFFNASDVRISDITIDGAGKLGHLFLLRAASDITISSVNAYNLNNNPFVFANVDSIVRNVVVENSRIEWNSTTWHRISLRGQGAQAVFRNNVFVNRGASAISLSFNTQGTNITLENNSFTGFTHLAHPGDHARTLNNTRILQTN